MSTGSDLITCRLGGWSLGFEEGGTLLDLSWRDGPSLLHWSDYDFDLGDGRVFHPRGWDECFPTIDAFGRSGVMGRIVGLAPSITVSQDSVSQQWIYPGAAVERTFRAPSEDEFRVGFEARNTDAAPLEFMWASHALFSVEGLRSVSLPTGDALRDFSRDMSCRKFFVQASGPARLEREESVVTLSTDQAFWGIWLNRGGWPAAGAAGFCCIGIEATNTDAEVPTHAIIPPGGVFTGQVTVNIEPRNS
jgi:hypothetical protein